MEIEELKFEFLYFLCTKKGRTLKRILPSFIKYSKIRMRR